MNALISSVRMYGALRDCKRNKTNALNIKRFRSTEIKYLLKRKASESPLKMPRVFFLQILIRTLKKRRNKNRISHTPVLSNFV